MKKKRIVIKIGSNVMKSEFGEMDRNIMKHIADQVLWLRENNYEVIMVVSGTVAAGKEMADFESLNDKVTRRQMYASLGQIRLISVFSNFFERLGIKISQALLTKTNLADRKTYIKIVRVLENLLAYNIVPIINENDVVTSDELSFGDNDVLASSVAVLLDADIFIILSSVAGLYNKDPDLNKDAKLVEEVKSIDKTISKMCSTRTSTCGLGGMLSKIKAIRLATLIGTECYIVPGKKENVLIKTIEERKGGTKFIPSKKKERSTRKRWLLIARSSNAKIQIDDGAIKALKNKKSLLGVGIKRILGEFERNRVVELVDENRETVGYGLSYYSSDDIESSQEIGSKLEKEVIHADNITML